METFLLAAVIVLTAAVTLLGIVLTDAVRNSDQAKKAADEAWEWAEDAIAGIDYLDARFEMMASTFNDGK